MKVRHRIVVSILVGACSACGTASQDLGNNVPADAVPQEAGPGPAVGDDGGRVPSGGPADGGSTGRDGGVDSTALGPAVLFGGFLQSDTWSWSGTAWTKLNLSSMSNDPGARESAVMAPLGGKLVLFGGDDPGSGAHGDTWTWDGATWTNMHTDVSGSSPAPRSGAVMGALGGQLVLFGGEDYGALYGDTWTWNGTAWALVQVAGPPARSGAVMARLGTKLVLFGGADASDTWTWDGAAWTQVSATGPSPRSGAVMAELNGQLFLFGGTHKANALADTWAWNGTAWTQQNVSGPSARSGAVITAFEGNLVLFGGIPSANGSTALGDTWTWDGLVWTQLNAPYHPPADFGGVMSVRR